MTVPASMLLKSLVCFLAIGVGVLQAESSNERRFPGVGQPVSDQDVARIDIDVMPDGRGLPAGSGSAVEGKPLYARLCANCHGEEGEGGGFDALAGGVPANARMFAQDPSVTRTIGNYWPYATTVFDYVRRSMPFDQPGSLKDEQVYALTAYLLYLNDLVDARTVIDAGSLPGIKMPALQFYVPDDRKGGVEIK